MELITANLASRVRYATLNGRQYLVAPLTLIVQGVLSGSQGALLYPGPEIATTVNHWHDTPLTVGHPLGPFGEPVSASDVPQQHVGMVRYPRFQDGKLSAEGWFDVEATRNADARVLESLKKGQPIELSTGLHIDNEPRQGNYKGRPYTGIARNYRPDHLAILPDQRGACSLDDGCGVFNERYRKDHAMDHEELTAADLDAIFGPTPEAEIDDAPLLPPTMNAFYGVNQPEGSPVTCNGHSCKKCGYEMTDEDEAEQEQAATPHGTIMSPPPISTNAADVLMPPTYDWQAMQRENSRRP